MPTYAVTITETGSASDAVNFAASIYVGAIIETGSANDTVSDVDSSIEAIAESGSANDVGGVVVSTWVATITEAGSASDAVSNVDFSVETIVETGSASDTVGSESSTFYVTNIESETASDTVDLVSSTFYVANIEVGSVSDAVNFSASIFFSGGIETGSSSDFTSANDVYPTKAITEAGAASDGTDLLANVSRYVGLNWANYSCPVGSDTGTTITVGSTNTFGSNGPINSGDTLIVVVAVYWITQTDATPITMTSDWTNVYNYADTTIGMTSSVWYKTATDSETGMYDVTWTTNSIGAGASWVLIDYAGISAFLDSSAGQQNHNTGSNIPAPALFPISPGDVVVCVWIALPFSGPYEIMPGMNLLANTDSINVPEIMVAASTSPTSEVYTATAGAAVLSSGISMAFLDPTSHVGFTPEMGSASDIGDSVLDNGNVWYVANSETCDASDYVAYDSVSSMVAVYDVGSTASWGNPVAIPGPIPAGSLIVVYATSIPTDTVGNLYYPVGDDIYYVPNCIPLSGEDSIVMASTDADWPSTGYQRTVISNDDVKFVYGSAPANQNDGVLSVLYATGINANPFDSGFYNTATGSSAAPSVTASAAPVTASSLILSFVTTALTTFFDFTQDIINAPYASPPATAQTGSMIMFGGSAISSAQLTYAPSMNVSQPWQASILAFAPPQIIGSIFTGQISESGVATDSSNETASILTGLNVETGTAFDSSNETASIFFALIVETRVASDSTSNMSSIITGHNLETGNSLSLSSVLDIPSIVSALIAEIGSAMGHADETDAIYETGMAVDSTDSSQIAEF